MKKSVCLYVKDNVDTKQKMDMIKKLGYDEFFTGLYDKTETISLKEQLDYARQLGLGVTMIHCSYKEPLLNDFWLDNETGDWVENSYREQIEICGGLTKNFIVHLNGSFDSIQSQIGLERIKRLLAVCEKYNINFCIENLYSKTEIPFIFKNISHKNLKICFDCGHRNFLTPNFDVLKDYGKYVSVLHLHDNHGQTDEHKILGTCSIDVDFLAKELAPLDIVLSAEIKTSEDDLNGVLQQNLLALTELENKIEKYRKQN